ncbi:MAG: hypothetical protein FJY29_07520 [Betaproteobacteria bacterium]|nr:hypothetical protein [Betaproteobacteria bacterium]
MRAALSPVVLTVALGFLVFLKPFEVFAAQSSAPNKLKPLEMPSIGSESEYYQVLGRLEQLDSLGQRASLVSPDFFQSLSWIGRTACVNYVCGILSMDQCRRVLESAIADDALVVRDHALRIVLSSAKFSDVEKRSAADRIIGDQRNYRKGRPFWIVGRAKEFLSAGVQMSAGQ